MFLRPSLAEVAQRSLLLVDDVNVVPLECPLPRSRLVFTPNLAHVIQPRPQWVLASRALLGAFSCNRTQTVTSPFEACLAVHIDSLLTDPVENPNNKPNPNPHNLSQTDAPPFVEGGYQYTDLALQWGAQYGIGVWLDFHAANGSQNGCAQGACPTNGSRQPCAVIKLVRNVHG